MSPSKTMRFSDRTDLDLSGHTDFITRRRSKAERIYSGLIMALLIVLGVVLLVYSNGYLASQVCVVIGSIMYDLGRKQEKLQRQLLATQFMSAMFASTLAVNCKFCLVAKPDGEIIYFDRGFQEMFPGFLENSDHMLETLFTIGEFDTQSRQRVTTQVAALMQDAFEITVTAGGSKHSLHLLIDPVQRPSGYILLRGKSA